MKNLLLLICLFGCFNLSAATIRVNQFDLDFYLDTTAYEIDFELEMACRYEKFVISDSAQYEYIYKNVPLVIKSKKITSSKSLITVSNKNDEILKMGGLFRSNKGCQTYLHFFFKSKKYSIGWANQFDRPIRLGHFEHSRVEEHQVFDISKLKNIFEDKEVSFIFRPVRSQVNVRLGLDSVPTTGMSTYLSTTTAIDSKTSMPFALKK